MTYKRTTVMTAYRVRSLHGSGLSQQAIARKLGIGQSTVCRLLKQGASEKQLRVADRMSYFGMLSKTGNTRRKAVDYNGRQYEAHDVPSTGMRPDDPVAILMAEARFGKKHGPYRKPPPRIDRPMHERVIAHGDTWEEYLEAYGGVVPLALACPDDGSSKLAREGADVSSYAVRDTRYDWGYPYRNTVHERNVVAALSVRRRRARARDGLKFLASLDPVRKAQYEEQYGV